MTGSEQNHITVLQGQFHVSNTPNDVMTTILGSCIATCVYDAKTGVGGMNHFLLPGEKSDDSGNLRYGVNSMELLINALLRKGARRENLEAKIFGGAKMVASSQNVGDANTEFARWFLRYEGIPCVNSSVGGTQGRKVRFWPTTGQAQQALMDHVPVRAAPPPPPPPSKPADSGDVDLF